LEHCHFFNFPPQGSVKLSDRRFERISGLWRLCKPAPSSILKRRSPVPSAWFCKLEDGLLQTNLIVYENLCSIPALPAGAGPDQPTSASRATAKGDVSCSKMQWMFPT
jgi:hypothetical protein